MLSTGFVYLMIYTSTYLHSFNDDLIAQVILDLTAQTPIVYKMYSWPFANL